MCRWEPQCLSDDFSKLLDDDVEMFAVKLQKLLIYETEVKKWGEDTLLSGK